MEKSRKVFLLVSMLVFVGNLFAYNHHKEAGKDKEKPSNNTPVINAKANCAPATAKLTMQFNDVSALLEAGGILFYDRANGVAAYEVPKGSRLTAIYSGALWMGGTDVNGQLKLAGQNV
jgi:hypothetical protein